MPTQMGAWPTKGVQSLLTLCLQLCTTGASSIGSACEEKMLGADICGSVVMLREESNAGWRLGDLPRIASIHSYRLYRVL